MTSQEKHRTIYIFLALIAGGLFLACGKPDSEQFIALCLAFASIWVADDIQLLSRPTGQICLFVLQLSITLLVIFQIPITITAYSGAISVPLCIVYGLLIRWIFTRFAAQDKLG